MAAWFKPVFNNNTCHLFVAALVWCGGIANGRAEDSPPKTLTTSVIPDVIRAETGYDFEITNGLYATIAGPNSFKVPEFRNDERVKLRSANARKDVELLVLWQANPAPLVVIFPGLNMTGRDPEVRLWASVLYQSGNSVLMFESPFRTTFNGNTQLGVSCNIEAEARVCGELIQSFMNLDRAKGKITKIGLFGASYGGTVALNLNRLAQREHDKIPLTFDRVLAYSPTLSLKTATEQLDQYQNDRIQNGISIDTFQKMYKLKAIPKGARIPFTDDAMRGAIGYYFHDLLATTVLHNNNTYKLKLLERETGREHDAHSDMDLSIVASSWSYGRYIREMAFPYWQKQGSVTSVDDLWRMGNVDDLMSTGNTNVRVVTSEDDPLNSAEDLRVLKEHYPAPLLTVHPCGGHLGYMGCKWAQERMTRFFE